MPGSGTTDRTPSIANGNQPEVNRFPLCANQLEAENVPIGNPFFFPTVTDRDCRPRRHSNRYYGYYYYKLLLTLEETEGPMQYVVSYSTSIWFCLRRVPAMGMNGTFLGQVLGHGPYYASRKYQLGWSYLYQCLTKLRTV